MFQYRLGLIFGLALLFLVGLGCSGAQGPPGPAGPQGEPGPAGSSSSGEVADMVLTNGKIYTVNEAQPWVEAVAIKDGKFLVVGSNADVEAVTGQGTEVVDLDGNMAMPGFIDLHPHPIGLLDGSLRLLVSWMHAANSASNCVNSRGPK